MTVSSATRSARAISEIAEAAQGLQGQGELVLARQPGMAAGEDHPQLTVFDLRVEKQLVDALVVRGAGGGPLAR